MKILYVLIFLCYLVSINGCSSSTENVKKNPVIRLYSLMGVIEWSENEDISIELRQLLVASREKVKLYGFPATKSPKLSHY